MENKHLEHFADKISLAYTQFYERGQAHYQDWHSDSTASLTLRMKKNENLIADLQIRISSAINPFH